MNWSPYITVVVNKRLRLKAQRCYGKPITTGLTKKKVAYVILLSTQRSLPYAFKSKKLPPAADEQIDP